MKVIVDELPIGCKEFGCDNCPYAEIQGINHYFINNEFVSYRDCVCKLDKTCGFKQGEKLCPLQSLSDYTKQVRKEVCEEIYRVLTNEDVWRGLKKWWLNNGECKELRQILDQIQGELSDRKKEEHSL